MHAIISKSPLFVADTVDGFLLYLRCVKGLSNHTAFHYGHDLSLFLRYLAQTFGCTVLEITTNMINVDHIEGFLSYQSVVRRNSERSAKRRLAALRSFFDYLYEPHHSTTDSTIDPNPISMVTIPKSLEPPPRVISSDDALRILRAARAHGPNPTRDYAILRLFLHCGARLSEVLQLTLPDVNLVDEYVHLGGNGKWSRNVPFSEETLHAIAQYITCRPQTDSDRVFLSRNGRPITKGAVYHLVNKCLSSAALDKSQINIHTMRHTCYTLLAKEGFGACELQALAGLSRPNMPKEYIKLASNPEYH